MQKKIILIFITVLLFNGSLNAQSLAINTDGSVAHTSALLDVKSTTRGLLIPRMSKAEKTSIASPAIGLLVYQNAPDSIGFHYYDGIAWVWLANSVTTGQWLLTGNNINNGEYMGTNNDEDLRFFTNGFERGRIGAFSGLWGFGEFTPQYNLDVSLGTAAVFPCTRNGLRLKPAGFSNACDNGFFVGLDNNNSIASASIWNYGNGASGGAQTIKLGLNNQEIVRFNDRGFEGLGESDPQYTFDMRLGIAAVYPCVRNGIRMNNTSLTNDCDHGLFVGYDNNNSVTTASFWNFGDGSVFPSGYVLRFGLGGDFTTGEKMRLNTNGGMGLGTTDPLAKIHIIDITAALLPGLMVTNSALPPSSSGLYLGLKGNSPTNVGRLWNYQNADIEIGTDNTQRMIVTGSGNVGVGSGTTASSTLTVDGTIAIGVSMGIGGGPNGFPTMLSAYKSYVGLEPTSSNSYYELPDPATYPGRVYYIRNNSNSEIARIGTGGTALICPGNGVCLAIGSFYDLNPTVTVKTIIAISDGINWTVGKID